MGRTTVSSYLIAKSSLNFISLQASRAALLGALLVAASLPAGTLAAAAAASRGNSQPDPSVRPGQGPIRAPNAAAGRGRYLVLQVEGSG